MMMPRPKGKARKIVFSILGKPQYLESKNWTKSAKVREKIMQDSYLKVK